MIQRLSLTCPNEYSENDSSARLPLPFIRNITLEIIPPPPPPPLTRSTLTLPPSFILSPSPSIQIDGATAAPRQAGGGRAGNPSLSPRCIASPHSSLHPLHCISSIPFLSRTSETLNPPLLSPRRFVQMGHHRDCEAVLLLPQLSSDELLLTKFSTAGSGGLWCPLRGNGARTPVASSARRRCTSWHDRGGLNHQRQDRHHSRPRRHPPHRLGRRRIPPLLLDPLGYNEAAG